MKKLNKAAVFMTALILAAVCACAVSAGTPLPGWRYTGSDPIEAAATEYAAGFQSDYRVSDVSVCVPAPVILRTEKTDDDEIRDRKRKGPSEPESSGGPESR